MPNLQSVFLLASKSCSNYSSLYLDHDLLGKEKKTLIIRLLVKLWIWLGREIVEYNV